jgi:flagellar hook-associated protein FlgK
MSSNTINILNSALQLNKKKMELAMQNIANASNENYSSKYFDTNAVVLDDKPSGVNINSVLHHRDSLLEKKFLEKKAETGATNEISQFYKSLVDKLAKPGEANGLNGRLNDFQKSLEALTIEASNHTRRKDFINKADSLSGFIRNLSIELQEDRLNFDRSIASSLKDVNGILQEINNLNAKRLVTKENSFDACQLDDNMSSALSKLAHYFDISYKKDEQGRINVFLKNDGQEIVGKNIYSFSYEAMASEKDFIDGKNLKAIYLDTTSLDGLSSGREIFINGGESGHVSYNLPGGVISAYLEMRDHKIPEVLDNLDQMALQLAQSFNNIHNKGVGATSLSKFTGTNLVKANDKIVGRGEVILNLMDLQGKPIEASPGTPESRIQPLRLDLTKLSTIPGAFNVQGLVDSINNHFQVAAAGKRLVMDGVQSVNLALQSDEVNNTIYVDLTAYSPNLGPDDMINFDFSNWQAKNSSGQNILTGTGNVSKNLNLKNGETFRTGNDFCTLIDFSSLEGSYPITLAFDLTTTVDGVTNTATMEFVINQPSQDEFNKLNGLNNKLYGISAVTSSNPDIKVVTDQIYPSGLVKASLVDEKGQPITDPTKEGFLQIESLGKNMILALDQQNTTLTSFDKETIRGGLSEAFGLNDFFVFNNKSSKNYASFFNVNQAMKDKPQAFAIGKMQEYKGGEASKIAPAMNFAMGANDTSLASEYLALQRKMVSFDATKNIDAKANSLSGYADEIISTYNILATQASIFAENVKNAFEGVDLAMKNLINVDADNQAINILDYQKHFGLAAKFLTVHNNLLQTLIDAV